MSLNEFEEKTGKKVKLYFKELAKEELEREGMTRREDGEMEGFNRKEYLDFNNSKLTEVMSKDPSNSGTRKDR